MVRVAESTRREESPGEPEGNSGRGPRVLVGLRRPRSGPSCQAAPGADVGSLAATIPEPLSLQALRRGGPEATVTGRTGLFLLEHILA